MMIRSALLMLLASSLCSARVHQRDCEGSVRHVHLAVGNDPATSMTVSFASLDSGSPGRARGAVLVGRSRYALKTLIIEDDEPLSYESLQPRNASNYMSPYQHHVTITGLKPQTSYYYQCITRDTLEELEEIQHDLEQEQADPEFLAKQVNMEEQTETAESEDFGRRDLTERRELEYQAQRRRLAPPPYDSTQCGCPDPGQIRSFHTATRAGHGHAKICIIGDIGQFAHSEETLQHIRQHHLDSIDSVILAGDISYAELDHRRWDTFFDLMDDYPVIDSVPLHIVAGNHDIDKSEFGDDIFLSLERRFRMPRLAPPELRKYDGPYGKMNMDRPPYPLPYDYGNSYYAFQYGRTHQIFLNSYASLEPGSLQYDWLVRELEEKVDRKQTPWLLVTYHVPIYNTFSVHQHDTQLFKMREHMEPLFVQHRVNIVFNGHIHAYLRTKPVAMGNVTDTGPIHIVMGAGGRNADATFLQEEPEEWVALRDGSIYGYGLLEIVNDTHARWDWVHTGEGSDHNVVLHHENVTLPPGGVDHDFFVNQLYL